MAQVLSQWHTLFVFSTAVSCISVGKSLTGSDVTDAVLALSILSGSGEGRAVPRKIYSLALQHHKGRL